MTSHIPHLRLLLLSTIIFLSASAAFPQPRSPDRGLKSDKPFSQDDLDSVNLTNGNVFLTIPLASLPRGRGDSPDFPISLNYNSKIWDMRREERYDGLPDENGSRRYFAETLVPADNGGWTVGIGYRVVIRMRGNLEPAVPCNGSSEMGKNAYSFRLDLRLPDGTEKELKPIGFNDQFRDGYFNVTPNGTVYQWNYATVGDGSASCSMTRTQLPGDMTYVTIDGSHLRLVVQRVAGDRTGADNPWSLYFPNGSVVENLPNDDLRTMQRITDRNGNRAYLKRGEFEGANALFVEDDMGRRTVIRSTSDATRVIRYGFGGEPVETKVEWKTLFIRKTYNVAEPSALNAPQSARNTELYQSLSVVAAVRLPHQAGGLDYEFDYNASPVPGIGAETPGWGEVKSVRLPTGAQISYHYLLDELPALSVSGDVLRNYLSKRILSFDEEHDGIVSKVTQTKTYVIGSDASLMTDNEGNTTLTRFVRTDSGSCDAGQVLSTKRPDGSLTENLWVNRCVDPYVAIKFTTVPDASGNPALTSALEILRDVNGNILRQNEYGFAPFSSVDRLNGLPLGVSAEMKIIRSTVNEYYNPTPPASGLITTSHIRLRSAVKSTELRDGRGVVFSRSEFEYDDPNSKGNTTVVRRWNSVKGPVAAADGRGFRLDDSNSVSEKTSYDVRGNALLMTDARDVQTEVTYSGVGGFEGLYPTHWTGAARTSVSMKKVLDYDFSTGLLIRETLLGNNPDEDVINEYSYDALGRPSLVHEAKGTPSQRSIRYEYDDRRRLVVTRSDRDVFGDGREVSAISFDPLGRVRLRRRLENPSDDAYDERRGVKIQIRHSSAGGSRYTVTSNPFRAETSDAALREESMGWRRERVHETNNLSEEEIFEGVGLPVPWGSNTATKGRISVRTVADATMQTDEAGRRQIVRRDPTGSASDVWEISVSGDESVVFAGASMRSFRTSYEYYPDGNLLKATQGDQQRTFSYDSLSRLISATNPESGTVAYRHDAVGNIVVQTDARGVGTYMYYDALNRIVHRSYTTDPVTGYSASPNVTYSYEDYRVPFSKGRLTRVHNSSTDERTLGFDALGNVTENEQLTDGKSYRMSYRYDLSGRLTEERYPSGRIVSNGFKEDGALDIVESRRAEEGSRLVASRFIYDPAGSLRGFRNGNGLWESVFYDSRMQTESISLGRTTGASDLLQLELLYGGSTNNGNPIGAVISAGGTPSRTQTFVYDDLNRLESATETAAGMLQWRQVFRYDRYGNRRFDETLTTTVPRNCLSGNKQIVCDVDRKRLNPTFDLRTNRFKSDKDSDGTEGYRYDASGNILRDAWGINFAYNSTSRQVQAEDERGNVVSRSYYDGLGRRVKKTTYLNNQLYDTTVFVYNTFGRPLAEYSDKVVPADAARTSYLTTDHVGSPRMVSDQYGRVVSRHDYLPFGEESDLSRFGADSVRRKFTGYERDDEIQLDYAGARHYSYRVGRFTSPDPLQSSMDPLTPQSFNRYSYAINNPLRYTDPTGELWIANTGDDRAKNPYRWVDSCGTGQSCWTTIAHDMVFGVRVYGTKDAKDIHDYVANEHGQIDVDQLLSHPDAKVTSVANSQRIPEPYLSTGAATALYNLGVRYRARYPNDRNLVFSNGNASDGRPCIYANGVSCHSGHRGGDIDMRYMDALGRPLVGASAHLSADPKRIRFIVDTMRAMGFPESFSGNASRLGTDPASAGTSRLHRNHLHVGIKDRR